MEVKKTLVTPKLAQQLLDANDMNRRVRQRTVIRYADEMTAGRWKEDTGEMIIISKKGNLLNGQHRLLAIIRAHVSIKFHIATDVEEDRFEVMDSGIARNAADAFSIDKVQYSNVIPSIMSTYFALKEGKPGRLKETLPSTSFLLHEYYKEEVFWQSAAQKSISWYAAFSKILAPSLIGGLYSLFFDASEEDAEDFISQLCTGLQITNESIGTLRQKLISDRLELRKIPRTYKTAIIIKTWNLYMTGESTKNLKWDSQREAYPEPVKKKKVKA